MITSSHFMALAPLKGDRANERTSQPPNLTVATFDSQERIWVLVDQSTAAATDLPVSSGSDKNAPVIPGFDAHLKLWRHRPVYTELETLVFNYVSVIGLGEWLT
ncbi:hypothetical protein CIHG_06480 [Coccidioides immitis H538.4]|uniref:Uncharacterized protein n=2 Tax=Coccidioides immitis TaxID=5501 RepID=A0A0J8UMN1_COCIT|nr:hypothetical protein CIHG_06480 [Coccidioides immitis H538.4]